MNADFAAPHFTDETAALQHLEAVRWPQGPVCPHCGETENVRRIQSDIAKPGLLRCNPCRKQFTVTIGTVYERSHIPLHKWLLATYLMCASKKGISAHQLHRMLGITYKSAWFMCHRIRESMTDTKAGPIGGEGKVVEVDETYVGGKAANRKNHIPPKHAVVALVERGGEVRAQHVKKVTAANLKPILRTRASRKSWLMSDEARMYPGIGDEYKGHGTVNHGVQEYSRMGGFYHTNTVENFFSILKRGIVGTFHHVSEQHLDRYVAEFGFRYNNRMQLGTDDASRAITALKGIEGKRLTYRRID